MSVCKVLSVFILSWVLAATTAIAQTTGDSTVGGGLSVFGATLETTYRIEDDLRLRGVIMGGLGVTASDEDDDGNSYDADISLAATAFLLDYFPDETGWRVSGGLLMDLTDITAVGSGGPLEPFEINGQTFEGGRVEVEGRFSNSLAPMVTAGYDYDFGNDWVLSGEVGAIYTGGIETEFRANSDALQDAIADDEDFSQAQRDAEDILVLPYLSVSVGFRF